jgi:hypothetical protein
VPDVDPSPGYTLDVECGGMLAQTLEQQIAPFSQLRTQPAYVGSPAGVVDHLEGRLLQKATDVQRLRGPVRRKSLQHWAAGDNCRYAGCLGTCPW